MSYSNTFCRKCEKNTYVNLEDSNMLCASCIREINEIDELSTQTKPTSSDPVVHKSIRWLQSWFFADGVTSSSAYLYWRSPKYKDQEFPVQNYLIVIENTNQSFFLPGEVLTYKLTDLEPGIKYSIKLEAQSFEGGLIKTFLKTSFRTAS